jgi:hypothetical protein
VGRPTTGYSTQSQLVELIKISGPNFLFSRSPSCCREGQQVFFIIFTRSTVVHPLVLLSVADHHARSISRNSHKRVVGVLLGQDNGKTINVANSFGIPFEEDEKDSKTWFLDHNYIEGMYEMFKKVNGVWFGLILAMQC